MHTTTDITKATGRQVGTVLAAIHRLGYTRTGRDYVLTAEQCDAVIAEMHDGPGRPRKDK